MKVNSEEYIELLKFKHNTECEQFQDKISKLKDEIKVLGKDLDHKSMVKCDCETDNVFKPALIYDYSTRLYACSECQKTWQLVEEI